MSILSTLLSTEISDLITSIDTTWMLIGTALVFFMQAGFAMVEAGFTRAKNAGNIIMKNLMDFVIGTLVFWFLGFGLMFASDNPVIGGIDLFTTNGGNYATLMFQTVFCATAATIVSGAMAERTKFVSYLIYSLVISMVIYPISGHWIWGGGWLAELGFIDFAGSTAVHLVGGTSALIGAKILGPRIGKYSKDGKSRAICGHNIVIGALGVFILWFCWFGFNGGSTVSMTNGNDKVAALVFYNTNMAAVTATLTVLFITWIRYKKPDVSMTLNGSLAGLVAITAGCHVVNPVGAAIIGIIAGFVVVFVIELLDKKLKIDDPVGAIGVHGGCGAIGTILVGLFHTTDGVFYGGGFKLLGTQVLGVIAVIAWVSITMTIVFLLIKKTIGLRASREEELLGLDLTEHGLVSAYSGLNFVDNTYNFDDEGQVTGTTPMHESVPVELISNSSKGIPASDVKITKVEIICRQSMFDSLKDAMGKIGVSGMTVTNVLGCGMQKGKSEIYRGVPVEINLLPKIQVEMVITKIPVSTVIETAKKVLYTGHIGDGKIFIYNVENAIRVRTGEEGDEAL